MNSNRYRRLVSFAFGAAIGATISYILGLLLVPQSGLATRQTIGRNSRQVAQRFGNEREFYSARIREATSEWVAKLRATADEMVARGHLSAEEADMQINQLLARVRGD